MRPIEKVKMIDKISLYLDENFTYSQIDMFLMDFGIDYRQYEEHINPQNKKDYAEELLKFQNSEIISKIALDLDINVSSVRNSTELATFWEQGYFKLFISHLDIHKKTASDLQKMLLTYGISGFVAHKDINPSKEWQKEIEKALHTMDALSAILTKGFKESNWCDQEVGFAVGKDVLIIPIKKEINPYGFIGKYQAIKGYETTVGEVSKLVFETIIRNPKTRSNMLTILSNLIATSTNENKALLRLEIFFEIDNLPKEILAQMAEQINNNSVLNNSTIFLKKLEKLFAKYQMPLSHKILNNSFDVDDDEIPF